MKMDNFPSRKASVIPSPKELPIPNFDISELKGKQTSSPTQDIFNLFTFETTQSPASDTFQSKEKDNILSLFCLCEISKVIPKTSPQRNLRPVGSYPMQPEAQANRYEQ